MTAPTDLFNMENFNEVLPIIREQFSRLKICTSNDKVFKDECVLSFDNPFTSTGLYVNLSSLQGFGQSYLNIDIDRGGRLYLHQRWIKMSKEIEIEKKELSIKESDSYEIIKEHDLVVVTKSGLQTISLPNSQLPEFLNRVIQSIIDHEGMKSKLQSSASWDPNESIHESKYAKNLIQLPNTNIKISQNSQDWKCQESGDTQNLWLNLSTGYIGGGRKNWDGSGGSGAALKHYENTGKQYPLCVKLGSITAHHADVWSYAEDEDCLVKDPYLPQHLAHWGINIMSLEKTDKSMIELEADLNYSYDWSRLMGQNDKLEMISAQPGYIGLYNIGSSCYMNSVLQVLLHLPEFQERYLKYRDIILNTLPSDPYDDFAIQLSKVTEALFTTKYITSSEASTTTTATTTTTTATNDVEKVETRIEPRMFKYCVARNHSEFSTGRQQDASEYFMYLLDFMTRMEKAILPRIYHHLPVSDPLTTDASRVAALCKTYTSSIFEYALEWKYQCMVTKQVKYISNKSSTQNTMEIMIPLKEAINQHEVEQYQERKKQKLDTTTTTSTTTATMAIPTTTATYSTSTDINMDIAVAEPIDITTNGHSNEEEIVEEDKEVRLHVPFQKCLETYFKDEVIEYRNPSIRQISPTMKYTRMKTFPRYLMVKLGRYYVGTDWRQVKVDASVPMPDELDLTMYRAPPRQLDEILMSEDFSTTTTTTTTTNLGAAAAINTTESILPDMNIVEQLIAMGFSENGCRRAVIATQNSDTEAAMNWILEHMDDTNFNDPIETNASTAAAAAAAVSASTSTVPSSTSAGGGGGVTSTIPVNAADLIEMICAMGYTADQATVALQATDYDIERAMDWIFSHSDDLDQAVADATMNIQESTTSSTETVTPPSSTTTTVDDGEGKYTLIAIITHLGKNTDHGHFLCHIRINNEWILFNDEKVAKVTSPPYDSGFMYLYKRNDNTGVL